MIDVLDEAQPWLAMCGYCDAGLPQSCTHPEGDYRPVMARLADEVEQLRAVVERVERDNCGCLGWPVTKT